MCNFITCDAESVIGLKACSSLSFRISGSAAVDFMRCTFIHSTESKDCLLLDCLLNCYFMCICILICCWKLLEWISVAFRDEPLTTVQCRLWLMNRTGEVY